VLIFRRIQLYTCSIWYCHSLREFVVACRYIHDAWSEKHQVLWYNVNLILILLLHILSIPLCSLLKRIPLQILYAFIIHAIEATYKACPNFYFTIPILGDQYKSNTTRISGTLDSLITSTLQGLNISKKFCNIYFSLKEGYLFHSHTKWHDQEI